MSFFFSSRRRHTRFDCDWSSDVCSSDLRRAGCRRCCQVGGMLRPDRGIERVYLHRAPVDMRKQIDGLAILARDVIQQDPLQGAMFAFINARRNKLKILVWERNGFILWYKRLERHRFHWPRVGEAVLTLSGVELNRLLDGYDVWMKPHEALHFSVLG